VSTDPLKRTFLGSALSGCWALKFLHALQIDQALLAHTGTGRGVPPKNFNRENLKFGFKFSVLGSITSGLLGVSSRNFFQSTCRMAGVINWVQFWKACLPSPQKKISEGQKSSQIMRDFWQLSTLIANISGTDPHIENRKSSLSTTPLPRWVIKDGILWSINEKVIEPNVYTLYPPKRKPPNLGSNFVKS